MANFQNQNVEDEPSYAKEFRENVNNIIALAKEINELVETACKKITK